MKDIGFETAQLSALSTRRRSVFFHDEPLQKTYFVFLLPILPDFFIL